MIDVPFDISYRFDDRLRDVLNSPTEAKQAIVWLQSQLEVIPDRHEQIQILGLMGGLLRLLGELSSAQKYLALAVEQSDSIGDIRLKMANLIRLAHVYQWQENYAASEAIFNDVIVSCQQNLELKEYLDFAYQHAGKCKFDQRQYEKALAYFNRAFVPPHG